MKKKTQLQLLKLKLKKALLSKQRHIQQIGRDNKHLQIQQTGRDVNINLRDFKPKRTLRTKKAALPMITGTNGRTAQQPATITTIGGRANPDVNQQKVLEQKIKDLEQLRILPEIKKQPPTPPAMPRPQRLLVMPKLRKTETPVPEFLAVEGPDIDTQIAKDAELLKQLNDQLQHKEKELETVGKRLINNQKAEEILVTKINTQALKHTELVSFIENLENKITTRTHQIEKLETLLKNPTTSLIRDFSDLEKTLPLTQQSKLRVTLEDDAIQRIEKKKAELTTINEQEREDLENSKNQLLDLEHKLAVSEALDSESLKKTNALKADEVRVLTEKKDLASTLKIVNYRVLNAEKARAGKVVKAQERVANAAEYMALLKVFRAKLNEMISEIDKDVTSSSVIDDLLNQNKIIITKIKKLGSITLNSAQKDKIKAYKNSIFSSKDHLQTHIQQTKDEESVLTESLEITDLPEDLKSMNELIAERREDLKFSTIVYEEMLKYSQLLKI